MQGKVLLDLSFLAHSSMWEEWKERNRLIMTCKGVASACAHHASSFSLSWRKLGVESVRNLKKVMGTEGENGAHNESLVVNKSDMALGVKTAQD